MTLDADLVRSRCGEIEESVARLERLARVPRPDLLGDQDSLDIACYRLLVAIEATLALCHHVAARHLRKVPEDYAACFAILHGGGILPADLTGRLQQMARFRNLLVHIYWKIDYGQVYEILQQNLGDLRQFASIVAALT
jgi:uncharacterized protein YutE (UPF0331/DUF86 family)